jgi:hypothetical protein
LAALAVCAAVSAGALLHLTSIALAAGDANMASCPNEALQGFAASLPDCRAFEMVSPPYKDGYQVGVRAVAADGSRVLGNSLGTFAGDGGAPQTRNGIGLEYEMARTPAGWQASALTPENPLFRGAVTESGGANADLTKTLFNIPTAPVGQDDFYIRSGASLVDVGPITPPADGPTLEPAPEEPPGSHKNPAPDNFGFEGGSADLSHIVFGIDGKNAWNGDPTEPGERDLYEYVGAGNSSPRLVGLKPGVGSTELVGECGTRIGGEVSKFNAVSEDGETIFFTPKRAGLLGCGLPAPAFSEVYARRAGSETVKLAEHSPLGCHGSCASSPGSDAVFAGASRDGSKAFFLSTQQLTDQASQDSTPGDTAYQEAGSGCQDAHESGCNLYEYDFTRPKGENLVAVSAGSTEPRVQGVVRISQDGSHVYFVARGKLTGEQNPRGGEAVAGANNLYVYERDAAVPGGRTRFIAALAPSTESEGKVESADEQVWGGVGAADVGRPADATPDGAYLVFESHADLTSDDTSKGVWQVFEYEAGTGALKRVSVGNHGFNNNGNTSVHDATITVPGYTAPPPLPQPRSVSEDGKYVFFQSGDSLTPGMSTPAAGSAKNVYEYHEGGVYLIYGGSVQNVSFLGASASGSDVVFSTTDALVPQDTDTQVDIYDARIAGGMPAGSASGACVGEGCRGASGVAPPFGVPGSLAQPGGENFAVPTPNAQSGQQLRARALAGALKRCRAMRRRKPRLRCETSARKRYAPKSSAAHARHLSKRRGI